MKLKVILAIILAGLVFGCGGGGGGDGASTTTVVVGSGILAQENRTVIGITGVFLAGEGSLHIEQGAAEELIVTAEDNLLPFIITEVQVHGGILEIRTQSNIDLEPTLPIEYRLTVVSLDSVLLSGVGDITVSDLVTPQLSLRLSGLGNVEVTNLDADELDVVHSGVGSFNISGTVNVQSINITGLGDYDARDLASLDAVISIVGNDNQTATVRVSDMLTVTINGNGKVFYIGNPIVDADITGSGSVEKINWGPPQLISPADGSCFNTADGSTSRPIIFRWEPVTGANRYFYKVWSSYPMEEFTGWIPDTEVTLTLWYIHESTNYSALYYWQVMADDGSRLTPFSDVRSVRIVSWAFPCE